MPMVFLLRASREASSLRSNSASSSTTPWLSALHIHSRVYTRGFLRRRIRFLLLVLLAFLAMQSSMVHATIFYLQARNHQGRTYVIKNQLRDINTVLPPRQRNSATIQTLTYNHITFQVVVGNTTYQWEDGNWYQRQGTGKIPLGASGATTLEELHTELQNADHDPTRFFSPIERAQREFVAARRRHADFKATKVDFTGSTADTLRISIQHPGVISLQTGREREMLSQTLANVEYTGAVELRFFYPGSDNQDGETEAYHFLRSQLLMPNETTASAEELQTLADHGLPLSATDLEKPVHPLATRRQRGYRNLGDSPFAEQAISKKARLVGPEINQYETIARNAHFVPTSIPFDHSLWRQTISSKVMACLADEKGPVFTPVPVLVNHAVVVSLVENNELRPLVQQTLLPSPFIKFAAESAIIRHPANTQTWYEHARHQLSGQIRNHHIPLLAFTQDPERHIATTYESFLLAAELARQSSLLAFHPEHTSLALNPRTNPSLAGENSIFVRHLSPPIKFAAQPTDMTAAAFDEAAQITVAPVIQAFKEQYYWHPVTNLLESRPYELPTRGREINAELKAQTLDTLDEHLIRARELGLQLYGGLYPSMDHHFLLFLKTRTYIKDTEHPENLRRIQMQPLTPDLIASAYQPFQTRQVLEATGHNPNRVNLQIADLYAFEVLRLIKTGRQINAADFINYLARNSISLQVIENSAKQQQAIVEQLQERLNSFRSSQTAGNRHTVRLPLAEVQAAFTKMAPVELENVSQLPRRLPPPAPRVQSADGDPGPAGDTRPPPPPREHRGALPSRRATTDPQSAATSQPPTATQSARQFWQRRDTEATKTQPPLGRDHPRIFNPRRTKAEGLPRTAGVRLELNECKRHQLEKL